MSFWNWLFGSRAAPQPGQRTEPARPLDLSALGSTAPAAQRATTAFPTVPTEPFRFIALDVETANDWPGSICQLGLACVRADGSILTLSGLLDPQSQFLSVNTRLHGIDAARVRGSPPFRTVFPLVAQALARQPVVQHSTFDRSAIVAACQRAGLTCPPLEWIDSVSIARRAWPHLKGNGGHGLASLKAKLDLTFDHHDAGADAWAAAQVVLRAEAETGQDFRDLSVPARRRPRTPPPATPNRPIKPQGKSAPSRLAAGHVVVFTGSLTISRSEANALARLAGMTVAGTVTHQTTLLVLGEQDPAMLAGHQKSARHRRAEAFIAKGSSLRIIGESEFIELVRDP